MDFIFIYIGISVFFVILERLFPQRKQNILRKGIFSDLLHFIFNGHYFGVWIYGLSIWFLTYFNSWVQTIGLKELVYFNLLSEVNFFLQFLIAFFVLDFLRWCVHNLLHRVPFLWEFHKVHHSIETMDWIGSMRFHWAEIVFYKSLLYLPIAFLGFDNEIFFYLAGFDVFMGHFNHSNFRLDIGILKYFFNSPQMHIWHHDYFGEKTFHKNFAINLSLWDWIFGTAFLPEKRPPKRLSFEGIENFPKNFFTQHLFPLNLALNFKRFSSFKNNKQS